ncbi:MAG: metalloregulator ArsR/SmtB family transcription factor [Actinomycetota bacterium]
MQPDDTSTTGTPGGAEDPNENDGATTGPGTASTTDVSTVLAGLRAAGEGTRLRILAILAEGELTVSELCRILGQTQPRVSRHLKLLGDAQLLDRHSEGTSAFYGLTRREPGRSMVRSILDLIDHDDHTLVTDRQRLVTIREERAEAAGRYFEEIAGRWDGVRSLHVADAEVEEALVAAAARHRIDGRPISSLLDIGTGTGRMLQLFGDRIERGLGIDLSKAMLNLARSNLTAAGLHHCTVRHGNIYALDVEPASFDLAVLHHVLHFLEEPRVALRSAADALRPGGQLLIVDFAPHDLTTLRTEHAHRWFGFEDQQVTDWCHEVGLEDVGVTHLSPADRTPRKPEDPGTDGSLLTVSLWTATRRSDRPSAEPDASRLESTR